MCLLLTHLFLYLLNILYYQHCKLDVSNAAVATKGCTIESKHIVKWLAVSERCEVMYLQLLMEVRGCNFGERKQ